MLRGAVDKRSPARLIAAGEIEDAKDFTILRLSDPDGNLVVLASAEK